MILLLLRNSTALKVKVTTDFKIKYEIMIFTGTEILFFTLGVITTLSAIALINWNKNYHFSWKSWALLILGFFLLIFSIAWAVSSVLEGEPRSASMGLVLFGVLGLIILALGRNVVMKESK